MDPARNSTMDLTFRQLAGRRVIRSVSLLLLGLFSLAASAKELHVAVNGSDRAIGDCDRVQARQQTIDRIDHVNVDDA